MKPINLILSTAALAIFISSHAIAADIQRGKQLHDENCLKCHTSIMGGDPNSIYTREDHRMTSLAALDKQVRRCKTSLGVSWPDDQIDDVVAYLNQTFYKFDN